MNRRSRSLPVRLVIGTLLLLGMLGHASARDQFLVLNTAALHFKNADERNALTPGIGWEYSPSKRIGFHLGTLSDSFGYQARYGGLNYATPRFSALGSRVRLLLGITVLHKQFHKNTPPDTKVVPLPAVEFALSTNAVLNISGSPEIDYAGHHNNAVMFFQVKLNLL